MLLHGMLSKLCLGVPSAVLDSLRASCELKVPDPQAEGRATKTIFFADR